MGKKELFEMMISIKILFLEQKLIFLIAEKKQTIPGSLVCIDIERQLNVTTHLLDFAKELLKTNETF